MGFVPVRRTDLLGGGSMWAGVVTQRGRAHGGYNFSLLLLLLLRSRARDVGGGISSARARRTHHPPVVDAIRISGRIVGSCGHVGRVSAEARGSVCGRPSVGVHSPTGAGVSPESAGVIPCSAHVLGAVLSLKVVRGAKQARPGMASRVMDAFARPPSFPDGGGRRASGASAWHRAVSARPRVEFDCGSVIHSSSMSNPSPNVLECAIGLLWGAASAMAIGLCKEMSE